ncbi:unnamed protein product [Parnassius mnemosyne]|uniref:Uncharacterized protein n=1 Tax=Parnassius mnemosyne TaxID=213953 RepID=A0AAV1LVI4_9NEOP
MTTIKDLGVTFDCSLTFHAHISALAIDCYKRLGFVLRNAREYQNREVIKQLFNTLLRSKLESAACVWNPYESKYVLTIEKVQKAFLRFLYKKNYGYYPFLYPTQFLLGTLGYNSVAIRHSRNIIIIALKILRGVIDAPELYNNLCKIYVPDHYLRHRPSRRPRLFATASSRTLSRANSPLCRMHSAINDLVKAAPDFDIFADSWNVLLSACLRFCKSNDILV